MSASKPTLTYFDIRGLAEVPRLCLVAAGVEFVDDRIPFEVKPEGGVNIDPTWAEKRKAEMPYNQVPVLTVDGVKIAQSGAIIRYIARTYGLEGSSATETALIDAGFEALADLRKQFYQNKDDKEKAAAFWDKTLGEQMALINKNVAGSPFFQGNKLSYVDVALYYSLWMFATVNKEVVDKVLSENPKVKELVDAVAADPRISAYVAARKITTW